MEMDRTHNGNEEREGGRGGGKDELVAVAFRVRLPEAAGIFDEFYYFILIYILFSYLLFDD